jgi:curved DNA-binding protein CbpA
MKNPFEILGLSPEICKKLRDEGLFALVKSSYRTLQTIYHPDRGGDHKRAIELNLAFEMLNYKRDPERFEKYKEKYIRKLSRRSRTRTKEMEEQIENQKRAYQQTSTKYYEYILYMNRISNDDHKNAIGSLSAVTIGLYDVALQKNIPNATHLYSTNYKQIKVDAAGKIFVKEVGSRCFRERKFTKFIGSISKEKINIFPHLKGYETSPHVPFNLRSPRKLLGYREPVFKNILLEENFILYCLPHLVPIIKENSYLISLNSRTKSLILDGCIIKISRDS